MMKGRNMVAAGSKASQAGMTLIEIMVVVMIMGLIMSAVGYSVFRWYRSAQKKTSRATVDTVVKAIWKWSQDEAENGDSDRTCPEKLDVLVPEYIKSKRSIKDAWGKRLKFRCDGDRICVYSLGPNKKDDGGGGDDIVSEGCKGE
ncbi:MAG: type II secretion system protein [Deltaproteobacteria bacterium]|nr:type II secretion system protein [Deltaproteobacteria bacterium]